MHRAHEKEPALPYYMRRRKSIRKAIRALLINRLDSQLLWAAFKPQVALNSSNIYAPTSGNFGYDEVITNGANIKP